MKKIGGQVCPTVILKDTLSFLKKLSIEILSDHINRIKSFRRKKKNTLLLSTLNSLLINWFGWGSLEDICIIPLKMQLVSKEIRRLPVLND